MRDKFELYEEAGVREYWIVDPEHESVQAFALQQGSYQRPSMHFGSDKQFSSSVLPEVVPSGEKLFGR